MSIISSFFTDRHDVGADSPKTWFRLNQPGDLQELLESGAKIIILSKGIQQRLQVPPATLEMLKDKGIQTHVLQTEEAVRVYNELAEKEFVGGLFHSTC